MSKPKLIIKDPKYLPRPRHMRERRGGLSEVSEAIQNEFGHVIPRSQRKQIARNNGNPFIAFTATESYYLLPHHVGRQLARAEAYKAKISSKKWRKAAGDR